MEPLSAEIIIEIFTLLDLADVKSLMQTSTVFHKVFVGSRNFIIQEAVKNCLDPKSLREILAIARSLKAKAWDRPAVLEYVGTYFGSQTTIASVKWDVSTALHIHQLQILVEEFSVDFASTALAKVGATNQLDNSMPAPSKSELQRFQHTFWKFELYCILFRVRPLVGKRMEEDRFLPEEQKSIFLDNFAAFENEQLGCVHDYLWDQVSRAFDDVAAHDVLWGAEWLVNWIGDYYTRNASWKEALLSRGLSQIMLMKNAKTYDARYRLVQGQTPCPDWDCDFLVESLMSVGLDGYGFDEELEGVTVEQIRKLSRAPQSPEPDDGPIEAWRWAYGQWYDNCYFFHQNWFFRQRAYVMWDQDRLARWSLLKSRRADLSEEVVSPYETSLAEEEEQRQSLEARSQVYLKGGLGWWSPDDLSRIEWPEDRRKKALSEEYS